MKRVREAAGKLGINQDMLRRAVNVGFSGGEKKRNEILQMALLQPQLCVLDETNSGLDIDALKIVAEGVNALRSPDALVHRHHALPAPARLHRAGLVHVLSKGRIVQDRRQGAGARARGEGLRRNIETRRREVAMNADVRADQDRGRDGAGEAFARRKRDAAGRRRAVAALREARSQRFERTACRTAGSRPGNTPICAR